MRKQKGISISQPDPIRRAKSRQYIRTHCKCTGKSRWVPADLTSLPKVEFDEYQVCFCVARMEVKWMLMPSSERHYTEEYGKRYQRPRMYMEESKGKGGADNPRIPSQKETPGLSYISEKTQRDEEQFCERTSLHSSPLTKNRGLGRWNDFWKLYKLDHCLPTCPLCYQPRDFAIIQPFLPRYNSVSSSAPAMIFFLERNFIT